MSLRPSLLALRIPCAPVLASLALLGLAACATATPGGSSKSPAEAAVQAPPAEERSAFGLFLAGQAALEDDSDHDAADYFQRAGRHDDEALIRQKAFLAAVVSGEIDRAALLAPPAGEGSLPMQKLGQLVRAVDALAEGRGKDANAAMLKDPGGFTYVGGYQLIKPWAAIAAGDAVHAVQLPDTQGQRLNRLAAMLTRSLIYERLKRYDEAESGYKTLTANLQLGAYYVLPYGAFMERRGRAKDASALYRKYLARVPGERSLQRALARAEGRKPAPPAPDLKAGAGLRPSARARARCRLRSPGTRARYLR